MLLLVLFAFLAGAGTAVSPCVLPVLPALLSAGATGGRRRPLGIALGLAVTFTVTIVGLASVVDELMMNALYDVPGAAGDRRAELRWAADDHRIAVSVADDAGALRQGDVIDHVRRARRERGRPLPRGAAANGAGIGLYLVASNVASLVINVAAGRRTEVVGLFDRASSARPAASCVRSLHVFSAAG